MHWRSRLRLALANMFVGLLMLPHLPAIASVQAQPVLPTFFQVDMGMLPERCRDVFERVSDPTCLRELRDGQTSDLGRSQVTEMIDGLNNPGGCLTVTIGLGEVEHGTAFAACVARSVAVEEEQRATLRQQLMDELGDPEKLLSTGDVNIDRLEGCVNVGKLRGLSEADANLACGLRLARIAEREATRAHEIINDAQAKNARCAELLAQGQRAFARVDAASDGKYEKLDLDDPELKAIANEMARLGCPGTR